MTGHQYSVVVAFDSKFLEPAMVTAASAALNTSEDVAITLLSVGISTDEEKRIRSILPSGRTAIVEADDFVRGMPTAMPPAAWARFGIGQLLTPHIARVIYLDADTLVRNSLNPLFNLDLHGQLMGAALEQGNPTFQGRQEWGLRMSPKHSFLEDAGQPPTKSYFNSGVLSIDLERWRSERVEARLLERAGAMPDSFVLPDQDILNVELVDEWLPIPWEEWNWPGLKADRRSWEASVVHFAGPTKPWDAQPYGAPFNREYRRAAEEVGWKIDPKRYRLGRSIMEAVTPYSLLLRRRQLARRFNLKR